MAKETSGLPDNIDKLQEAVRAGWKLGRAPLFIIGAGCTPIELNQYLHAEWAIRSFREKEQLEYQGYEYRNIFLHDKFEETGQRVGYLQSTEWFTTDRPYQALFFSDLKLKHEQKVWQIFCRSFLFEWISQYLTVFPDADASESTSLGEGTDIYKMYDAISDMVKPHEGQDNFDQYCKGHILTTNYDGTLPEYIRRKEKNCSIISDINGIKMLPLSLAPEPNDKTHSTKSKSPFITILRGDVYHSICNNKLCSSEGREVAVYNLIRDQIEAAKNMEDFKEDSASYRHNKDYNVLNQFSKLYDTRNDGSIELRIVLAKGIELRIVVPGKLSTNDDENQPEYFFEKLKNNEDLDYDLLAKSKSGIEVQLKAISNDNLSKLGDRRQIYKWKIESEHLVVSKAAKANSKNRKNWSELVVVTKESLGPILKSAFQLERNIVDNILRCPECGESRILNISFPGLEQKEMEIADTMEALWSVLGNSISLICSAGFSGNSDREVVNYLVKFAEKNNCKWFNVGRENASSQPHTAVRAAASKALGDGYIFMPIGAKGLSNALSPVLNEDFKHFSIPEFSGDYPWKMESSIKQDGMWVAGDSNTAIPMQRGNFAPPGSPQSSRPTVNKQRVVELRKDFPGAIKGLHDELQRKSNADIDIVNVSQLALKAFWWNPVEDGSSKKTLHNRFKHSLGVMRVADAWFRMHNDIDAADRHIDAKKHVPEHARSWLNALRISALLHDTGHIVFSHLMEEVFRSLNWSFHPNSSYSHEQFSKIRAKILLGSIIDDDLYENKLELSNDAQTALDIFDAISRIMDSETGVAWLDAILNSPLDADKIDYIFRDQQWLEITGRLQDHDTWLSDFLSSMRLSSQGQIFLDGRSAVATYNLLSERTHLYDTLYFSPKVRVLERITGEILKTYFKIKIQDVLVPEFIDQLFEMTEFPTRSSLEKTIEYFAPMVANYLTNSNSDNHKLTKFVEAFLKQSLLSFSGRENEKTPVELNSISLSLAILDLMLMSEMGHENTKDLKLYFKEPRDHKKEILDSFSSIKDIFEDLNDNTIPEVKVIMEICSWAILSYCDESRVFDKGANTKIQSFRGKECCKLAKMCELVLGPPQTLPDIRESDARSGRWLEWVFEQYCIAGPFVLRPPTGEKNVHDAEDWLKKKKQELLEVGKELAQLYPGRFLLDVTGPLKVRTYPSNRIIHDYKGHPVVCDQFWVPDGDPQSWSAKSRATIPLSRVDFRGSIPQAYKLRVLVIDPTPQKDGQESRVDHFRQICRRKRIELELA